MTRTPAELHTIVDRIADGSIDQLRRRLNDQREGIAAATYDNEGGRPSDHSDPTFAKATRPTGAGRDELLALDKAIANFRVSAQIIGKLIDRNGADPTQRPELWKPCRRGNVHQPDFSKTDLDPDAPQRCSATNCGRTWPCNDDETESWWQPCKGTIDPSSGKCTDCAQLGRSWVCRDCGDVFTDGIDRPSRNERCEKDNRRMLRAQERNEAA